SHVFWGWGIIVALFIALETEKIAIIYYCGLCSVKKGVGTRHKKALTLSIRVPVPLQGCE
ncbi:MAG: hypothetical protein VXX11_02700, partial [Planctomycetota bacterium]|nr:hypothetical protein [Planctomycetota bacterium]